MRDMIEINGRAYAVMVEHDNDMRAPWEEDDGHGPVSEWRRHAFGQGTKPPKSPGELILLWERGSYRAYDFAGACRIARRDGWGDVQRLPGFRGRDLTAMFPGQTPRAIAARAAYADYDRLRQWCNDQWHWCGVVVERLDDDGHATGEIASRWGLESDDHEWLEATAHELAAELDAAHAAELAKRQEAAARRMEASRPDMYA